MTTIQINKKDSLKVEYDGVVYVLNLYYNNDNCIELGKYIKKQWAIDDMLYVVKKVLK